MQEFRAEWCREGHNILPFQLPSAHVLCGPRKALPRAFLSTIGIPPPWSLSFSTTHWDPCQLCSGHSRNKCNTQKAPEAHRNDNEQPVVTEGKQRTVLLGVCRDRAVLLLCRLAGWRVKDSLMEGEQEGGKGEGRRRHAALFQALLSGNWL